MIYRIVNFVDMFRIIHRDKTKQNKKNSFVNHEFQKKKIK